MTVTPTDLVDLRKRLQLSQGDMAVRLGIAREWLSKLENDRAPISADIILKYFTLKREADVTVGRDAPKPQEYPMVEETIAGYGGPASRRDCEDYFRTLCDIAVQAGDPNAFPYILRTMQKALPLADFSVDRQRRVDEIKKTMPAPRTTGAQEEDSHSSTQGGR